MLKSKRQVFTATAALALAAPLAAQSTLDNDEPIGTPTGNAALVDPGTRYAIPDASVGKQPLVDEHFFTLKPHLVVLLDYTAFNQDADSIAQVGVQPGKFEIRSLRLQFVGTIGRDYKVGWMVSGEYKGFDSDPDTRWNLTDLNLTFPLGDRAKLILGKQKETFAYEMVGDAANLSSSERVLNPFFISRNTGAKFIAVVGPGKRGTFSTGVYYDEWDIQAAERRGVDVTARGTVLLWDQPETHRFLHLGLAGRHVASAGELRYKGRPGSNVASNFVDTGKFAADGAFHVGLETMLGLGPVQLAGEYVQAQVDAPTKGNPVFHGWYVTGSWVLTGESRPYDRNVGYARRVIPKGRWGAPELAFRYARTDLTDAQVDGGSFERVDLGINWWATTRWKAGVVWGRTWLDRNGLNGQTDTLLTRLQWVY